MTVFPDIHSVKKTSYKKCVNGFIPKSVLVPLRQDMNEEAKLLVNIGDTVTEGQLIAQTPFESGKSSSCVYSPIPGTVTEVSLCVCPDGKTSSAVKIKLGGSFSYIGKKRPELSLIGLTPSAICEEIALKGIVNTFVPLEPAILYDDIKKAVKNNEKLLVVRLFDEDSSRLTDSLLTKFFTSEILEGSAICAKAMGAEGIIFVSEKDFIRPENVSLKYPVLFVTAKEKKYPSGYKNQICSLVRAQVKDETFSKVSPSSLFTDSSTMLELYRTIKFGFPATDRYVMVSGECLNASGLVKVVHGTTLRSLSEQFGGFVKEPGAVIINGFVSGTSVENLDCPITKYVKSVTFIPERKIPDQRMSVCVHCGSCRRICPEKLSPDLIYAKIRGIEEVPDIYEESQKFCTNCALCSAVCPARLPLGDLIYGWNKNETEKEEEK